jgi:3-hydroxybutyrate dehydrogenase
MSDLKGRAALVTGGGSGIGRVIVERLLDAGMDVLNVDIDTPEDAPGSVFAADLTTRTGNCEAVQAALERFGRLDVVVPNAGFQTVAPVAEFDEDRWDSMLALMLTSPFLLAKHAWAALAEHGDGRFIAIASVHGLVASPFKAAYISAKHGVLGLVKTLALEGADVGVLATAVCPSYVRTPLVEAQVAAQAKAHGIPEERVLEDVILASQPIKRMLEPSDVAEVVAMLAGPTGRAFSGVPVTMDLGWSAR